jgi:pilus assembly protein CpaB
MNARSLLIIVAALLIAGVTAFLAKGWLTAQRAQVPAQTVVQQAPSQAVLVAATNLPAGLFLKEEHLRWQAWPGDTPDPNYFLQKQTDLSTLLGSVVRRGFAAGEPITGGKIVKPGDRGFLAAVLKPGMRAVTVKVNETTGVAGLVFPGDRVDMILTIELTDDKEDTPDRKASETVLENVRILAIGQQLDEQSEKPISGETATIEVTPKQAEMVAVAVELGRLSLSLRSLPTPELNELGHVAMSSDVPEAAQDPLIPADAAATASTEASESTANETSGPAATQDEEAENPSPVRGLTYTFDSEVSQLLTSGTAVTKVTVHHGAAAESLAFD